jgi:hypothetical protein
MAQNTCQMLEIAFPLVLSRLSEEVMWYIFLYGGGLNATPLVLASSELGMHQAFLVRRDLCLWCGHLF